MNFLTSKKLVQTFINIASSKTCHGTKDVPELLCKAFEVLKDEISDDAMYRIHKEFCLKANRKSGWGYKQLGQLLSEIVEVQVNVN